MVTLPCVRHVLFMVLAVVFLRRRISPSSERAPSSDWALTTSSTSKQTAGQLQLRFICCDVTMVGDKLRDAFQQLENQGLHLPEIEVSMTVSCLHTIIASGSE